MSVRSEMLDAWQQYDDACERNSRSKGKSTEQTLKQVTDRHIATFAVYAAEQEVGVLVLKDILTAWRRAGFNHERALRAFEAGLKEIRWTG